MPRPVDRAIQQLGAGGRGRVYLPGVVAAGPKLTDSNADFTQDVVFEVEIVFVK